MAKKKKKTVTLAQIQEFKDRVWNDFLASIDDEDHAVFEVWYEQCRAAAKLGMAAPVAEVTLKVTAGDLRKIQREAESSCLTPAAKKCIAALRFPETKP